MSQRRDRAGRFARSAVQPPTPAYERASEFTPTVLRAEQARGAGMRGLYRRHLDRAAEILEAEAARGYDDYLLAAVRVWRAVRARDFVARDSKEAARLTFTCYTGGDGPVCRAAEVALADIRRR